MKHALGTWEVYAAFRILKDGTTSRIAVLGSPSPELSKLVVDSISISTYEPFLYDGKPIEVEGQADLKFAQYEGPLK